MRPSMRLYLFVAAVMFGVVLALALGTATGRIFVGCKTAEPCVRLHTQ